MKKLFTIIALTASLILNAGNPNEINLRLNTGYKNTQSNFSDRHVALIGGALFILAGTLNMTMNNYGHNPQPHGPFDKPLFNKNAPNSDNYTLGHFMPIISGVFILTLAIPLN